MKTARRQCCLAVIFVAVVGGLVCFVPPARAEEETSLADQGPIQRRLFELDHELSLGWSYLPLDAYYKGYGVQIAYTIHFNHLFALELFRVGWSYNVDSKLKNKLIDQMPDISPGEFPAVLFWENTNLLFKLFYGKQSFLNNVVLHFELYATAGVAFVFRNPYPIWEGDLTNAHYEFGVNGGFGARFWFSPTWSIRLDLRDTVILLTLNRRKFPMKNSAMLGLSFAVNL
jgi:outer membrane beta-barrel protein